MTDADQPLTTTVDDGVALLTLDDGKANAVSHRTLELFHAALDEAEADAATGAVVLAGRPGRYSAGFHLPTMTESVEAMRGLVTAGAEALARLVTFPLPVVGACTGHALAMGSLLLLACDTRVGARGEFKLGLNEVGIGMQLPVFAVELARARLDPRALTAATLQGRVFDPDGAREAGYLDEVVEADEVVPTALARARELGTLSRGAYRETKERLRGGLAEHIRTTLAADLADITGPEAG